MATFKALSVFGSGYYFQSNLAKANGNSTSSYSFPLTSSSTLSKFYVCKRLSDNKNFAFWGGSTSTNTSCSSFLDNGSYTFFTTSGDSWQSFFNIFHIPLPTNITWSSLTTSSSTLAFPYENTGGSNYNVDFSSPIVVSLSNGKLSSSDWDTGVSGGLASFSYDTDWFASSSGGGSGGDTPSGDTSDYSQISNAIYSLGAVIIVIAFFSMIYKIFHRLRG